MNPIHISTAFDSGAIEVLSATDPRHIQLRIPRDNAAEFAQWFHFALHGAQQQEVCLHLVNASESAYPQGWVGYQMRASYDRQNWFQVDSHYDGKELTVSLTPQANCIYFAYFEPYSWERHLDLIGSVATSPWVQVERLGASLDGRDMTLLKIAHSDAPAQPPKRKVWLIARQHPGETMAEWFVEGFLERLLDADDALAKALLTRCEFYVVPNMNPDGSVRGNLRTNAAGANLNREWQNPSAPNSPEVLCVRAKMLEVGVDLCLDAHGHETIAYNFVIGSEGNPAYSPRMQALEDAFKQAWVLACPDFQTRFGNERVPPGKGNPTLATNWVAQQFGCLAFTIEMPFKDNDAWPDALTGWNGERSRKLGASVLHPIWAVVNDLR